MTLRYRGICYSPVSVSVTIWFSITLAQHTVTQTTTDYDSRFPTPRILWNSDGITTKRGAQCRWIGRMWTEL